jgi:tetratricopeptide (TPR) repeat protein
VRTYKLRVVPWHAADVSRLVEMTAKQTLGDLHEEIQDAFELDNDHLFAFFMRNKLWVEEFAYGGAGSDYRDASGATLESLELRKNKRFLYLFDFGDELTFDIRVEDVGEETKGVSYPRILESVGEAPPQYPDEDEEDFEGEGHDGEHCHDDVELDEATQKLLEKVKPFVLARDSLIEKRLDDLEVLEAANADLDGEDAFDDDDDDDDDNDEDDDDDDDDDDDEEIDDDDGEDVDFDEALREVTEEEELHLPAEGLLEEAALVEAVADRGRGNADLLHYLVAHAIEGDVIGWMVGLPRRLHLATQSARAADVCRALLDVLPTDALKFTLPVYLAAAGKKDEALAVIARNIEEFPEESGMLEGAGQAYLKLGDDVRAERCLRDALAAAGRDVPQRNGIVTALAGIFDRQGRGADLSELERREVEYRERAWRKPSPTTVVRTEVMVDRNDPCPCGSGKKYKKCCGAN